MPNRPDPLSDFRNFLYLVWQHLGLPEPTPVQYDIAHYLQHGPSRLIVEAARGFGKSWITSAYVVWTLLRDPQKKILVVSASRGRSDNFSTFTFQLLNQIPMLRHLRPRPGQRNSKISFDVGPATADHAPSVRSVGVFGMMSGARADLIVPDDVEVPNNSLTPGMRSKLSEAVKEFDAILKPGGQVRFLGTPQSMESLYPELESRGYKARIWPARFPGDDLRKAYGSRLGPLLASKMEDDPDVVGKPTEPTRFPESDLREREASYGRAGFALQFMLDTSLSDAERYPLKLSDLQVMSLNPEVAPEHPVWAAGPDTIIEDLSPLGFSGDNYYRPMKLQGDWIEYSGRILAIDPSGRGKDELAWCVLAVLHGHIYLLHMAGSQDGYTDEVLEQIAQDALKFKAQKILIEANFGDGMFNKLLQPWLQKIHPCTIEEVKHSKQKETRIIDTLEPVLNQHRLVVDRQILEKDYLRVQSRGTEDAKEYSLAYQLTHIQNEKGALIRDDRLDVLSIGVAYWVEHMGISVDQQMEKRRQKLLEEDLLWITENQAFPRKPRGNKRIWAGREAPSRRKRSGRR
jgi:hypothetical protein